MILQDLKSLTLSQGSHLCHSHHWLSPPRRGCLASESRAQHRIVLHSELSSGCKVIPGDAEAPSHTPTEASPHSECSQLAKPVLTVVAVPRLGSRAAAGMEVEEEEEAEEGPSPRQRPLTPPLGN